jgi:hypothetical protein
MFGTWILNINGSMRKLILVGIGTILWGVWLSQNAVAFDKKTNFVLYVGNIHGYALGEDLVIIPRGGSAPTIARCLLSFGNGDNRDFCKA